MKILSRLKWVLLMAAMTMLLSALSVQAKGSITLQVDGIGEDGKVQAGKPLTFRAGGGEKNKSTYMLLITVDGNEARYPMNDNGYLSLATGGMDSSWSMLPVGLHYEVQALNYRYLSGDQDPYMYSPKYTFDVVYPEPDYYKLEAYTSRQFDIDYWAGQYGLDEPPVLYRKEGTTYDRATGMQEPNWVKYLSPLELGAVFRYEITDASGKVVSRDGLVKGCGTYNVKVYELFRDPLSGKTVRVAAVPVDTVIADASTIKPDVDPDTLDRLGKDMGDLAEDLGDLDLGKDVGGWLGGLVDDIVNGPKEPEEPKKSEEPKKPEEPKEPEEPEGVTTVAGTNAGNAVVKFNAVENADGYEVVYGTTKNLAKNTAKVSTKKTSVTLKKLSAKKTYYVKVRAYTVNKTGKKAYSDYSATKKIANDAVKSPKKPEKVTAQTSKNGKNATVKFKAVKGAAGYEIVYGTTKSLKKNTKKVSTRKTGATLKKLLKKKTYYVKVRAYVINGKGEKVYGSYSAAKKIKK